VFRKRIILGLDSDASDVCADVAASCRTAGLSAADIDATIAQLRGPVTLLIDSGKAVASTGGQFRADRTIETDRAVIMLVARFGVPLGLFAQIRKALFGGR
jgi:hypothetical protein